MKWDVAFTLFAWAFFLFVWLPRSYLRHKKRMRSLRAINKGHRFIGKYQALKRLNRRSA